MTLKEKITAQLELIRQRLSVVLDAPAEPGAPAAVRLNSLPTHLQLVDSVPTDISLGWLSKDVLLKTGDDLPLPAAAGSALPLPADLDQLIQSPLPLPLGDGLGMPSGIPGVIGQFLAQLPVNIPLSLPVHAEVTWSAADEEGKPLPENQVQPTKNITGLDAVFFFAPRLVPYSDFYTPVTMRKITAQVKLSVKLGDKLDPVTIDPFPLEVEVPVPTLPVPVVLAALTHNYFDLTKHGNIPGGVGVFVPRSQLFYDVGTVLNALGTLTASLSRLSLKFPTLPGVGSVGVALSTINKLVRLLRIASGGETNPKAYYVVRPGDEQRNLDDVELPDGTDLNKEFGSMILVGPPGTWVSFFNKDECKDEDGAFDIGFKALPGDEPLPEEFTAETIAVAVKNLHGGPDRDPWEALVVTKSPKEDETFGDHIASLRFNR